MIICKELNQIIISWVKSMCRQLWSPNIHQWTLLIVHIIGWLFCTKYIGNRVPFFFVWTYCVKYTKCGKQFFVCSFAFSTTQQVTCCMVSGDRQWLSFAHLNYRNMENRCIKNTAQPCRIQAVIHTTCVDNSNIFWKVWLLVLHWSSIKGTDDRFKYWELLINSFHVHCPIYP